MGEIPRGAGKRCVEPEHQLLHHKAHLGQIILVVKEYKVFPFPTALGSYHLCRSVRT